MDIDFIVALVGGNLNVDTLNGPKKINVPSGAQNNQEIRIKNEGFSKLPPNQ